MTGKRKKGVYVVAYSSRDDREARRNEVKRKLVTTEKERNRIATQWEHRGYWMNWETESRKPLVSGNHAASYLSRI